MFHPNSPFLSWSPSPSPSRPRPFNNLLLSSPPAAPGAPPAACARSLPAAVLLRDGAPAPGARAGGHPLWARGHYSPHKLQPLRRSPNVTPEPEALRRPDVLPSLPPPGPPRHGPPTRDGGGPARHSRSRSSHLAGGGAHAQWSPGGAPCELPPACCRFPAKSIQEVTARSVLHKAAFLVWRVSALKSC